MNDKEKEDFLKDITKLIKFLYDIGVSKDVALDIINSIFNLPSDKSMIEIFRKKLSVEQFELLMKSNF
jgi:hypothetical protein